MALIGTLKTYTYTQHPTETQESTITYPSAEVLGEGHPDYDKAGTTETITEPTIVENETIHENVYVTIFNYFFYNQRDDNGVKVYNLDLHYGVFNSEEDYISNPLTPSFTEDVLGRYVEITSSEDIRTKGYELLKLEKGFENLIDI